MRFMHASALKKLLGVPPSARIDRETAAAMLPVCKSEIVKARLISDDSKAAELSQAKEFLKRRAAGPNICAGTALRKCGTVINREATHCRLCAKSIRMGVNPIALPVMKPRTANITDESAPRNALANAGGNIRAAARISGISRQALAARREMKQGQARTRSISKEQMLNAIERFGSQTLAATILGMARNTLVRRLRRYRAQ